MLLALCLVTKTVLEAAVDRHCLRVWHWRDHATHNALLGLCAVKPSYHAIVTTVLLLDAFCAQRGLGLVLLRLETRPPMRAAIRAVSALACACAAVGAAIGLCVVVLPREDATLPRRVLRLLISSCLLARFLPRPETTRA